MRDFPRFAQKSFEGSLHAPSTVLKIEKAFGLLTSTRSAEAETCLYNSD